MYIQNVKKVIINYIEQIVKRDNRVSDTTEKELKDLDTCAAMISARHSKKLKTISCLDEEENKIIREITT